MVRGFTEEESKTIKAGLMKEGRILFGQFGLRRTSIASLTKAVGISPSTFYNFFTSKEELYAAIFEEEEERMHEQTMRKLLHHDGEQMADVIYRLLKLQMDQLDQNPFLKQIVLNDDISQLWRKLPKERVHELMDIDYKRFGPIISQLQSDGKVIGEQREVLITVFQLFLLLYTHQPNFESELFNGAIDLMSRWIAEGLTSVD